MYHRLTEERIGTSRAPLFTSCFWLYPMEMLHNFSKKRNQPRISRAVTTTYFRKQRQVMYFKKEVPVMWFVMKNGPDEQHVLYEQDVVLTRSQCFLTIKGVPMVRRMPSAGIRTLARCRTYSGCRPSEAPSCSHQDGGELLGK